MHQFAVALCCTACYAVIMKSKKPEENGVPVDDAGMDRVPVGADVKRISITLPVALLKDIEQIAGESHRNRCDQIRFFLATVVRRRVNTNQVAL